MCYGKQHDTFIQMIVSTVHVRTFSTNYMYMYIIIIPLYMYCMSSMRRSIQVVIVFVRLSMCLHLVAS